jgi:hypothetical protein
MLICSFLDIGDLKITDDILENMNLINYAYDLNHTTIYYYEDKDCKRWNNYVKRVNHTMGAGLKYQKNRITGMTPF